MHGVVPLEVGKEDWAVVVSRVHMHEIAGDLSD
jgi:hypothetical protein